MAFSLCISNLCRVWYLLFQENVFLWFCTSKQYVKTRIFPPYYRGMIFLIGPSKLANVCPTSASKTTLMCHEANKKLKINHFMSLASFYTP